MHNKTPPQMLTTDDFPMSKSMMRSDH